MFLYKILNFSPLTNTFGFSRGGVRDSFIHYAHLKKNLKLL